MPDIITTGELLIDFTPVKAPGTENAVCPNPGGAPGNCLAAMNAYGCKTAFIGKVGDDMFGRMLMGTLKGTGIETNPPPEYSPRQTQAPRRLSSPHPPD